jgi:hypothetical protein
MQRELYIVVGVVAALVVTLLFVLFLHGDSDNFGIYRQIHRDSHLFDADHRPALFDCTAMQVRLHVCAEATYKFSSRWLPSTMKHLSTLTTRLKWCSLEGGTSAMVHCMDRNML